MPSATHIACIYVKNDNILHLNQEFWAPKTTLKTQFSAIFISYQDLLHKSARAR